MLLLPWMRHGSGGLYRGRHAELAAARYWHLWLPLVHKGVQAVTGVRVDTERVMPPLDVALVWLVHRLDPEAYEQDCQARFGSVYHPTGDQAFGFTNGAGVDVQNGNGSTARNVSRLLPCVHVLSDNAKRHCGLASYLSGTLGG
jgi:hypothetical protein